MNRKEVYTLDINVKYKKGDLKPYRNKLHGTMTRIIENVRGEIFLTEVRLLLSVQLPTVILGKRYVLDTNNFILEYTLV